MRASVACVALAALVMLPAGCATTQRSDVPADERFGHRYATSSAGGRETVVIVPADSAATFFYYPAPFDTVHIRAAPFEPGIPPEMQEVPVEVLVKGSFPDACTELHALQQDRAAHILDVRLEIRRPRGSVCAAVVRPYRFYFMLEGRYRPGHYTMRLNNEPIPFQVIAPDR